MRSDIPKLSEIVSKRALTMNKLKIGAKIVGYNDVTKWEDFRAFLN
ncbi:MAG: hypothetical protein KAU16_08845 [Methanophagales archaeon]|nr:hypothetical protein [Methanophagales archaeon]